MRNLPHRLRSRLRRLRYLLYRLDSHRSRRCRHRLLLRHNGLFHNGSAPGGYYRQQQGCDHENNGDDSRHLTQKCRSSAAPEKCLAGSAKGGPDLSAFSALKQDNSNQKKTHKNMNYQQENRHQNLQLFMFSGWQSPAMM